MWLRGTSALVGITEHVLGSRTTSQTLTLFYVDQVAKIGAAHRMCMPEKDRSCLRKPYGFVIPQSQTINITMEQRFISGLYGISRRTGAPYGIVIGVGNSNNLPNY